MSDPVFLYFNGWGLLGLVLFALGYAASHFFAVKDLTKLDNYCKVVGFLGLILIFVLSGWKAGLVALPIAFVVSLLGAALARSVRN